jgi:hypothetical protein
MSPKMESNEFNDYEVSNLEQRVSNSVDKMHENVSENNE